MFVSRQHIKQLISLSNIAFHVVGRCTLPKPGGGWRLELITWGGGGGEGGGGGKGELKKSTIAEHECEHV